MAASPFFPEDISALAKVLEINEGEIHATVGAHWFPNRTLGTAIPSDPVVYRLYEVSRLYSSLSALSDKVHFRELWYMASRLKQ